tara:strand:- start:29220 stop:29381 length:162 start_codon:yes stop_codon:yes gene_type:complete
LSSTSLVKEASKSVQVFVSSSNATPWQIRVRNGFGIGADLAATADTKFGGLGG